MKKNKIRYIKVEESNIEILYSKDVYKAIKELFKGKYIETTDYIFDDSLDIRIFVGVNDSGKDPAIKFFYNDELWDEYYGPVIFSKFGNSEFKSLSDEDIKIIKEGLLKMNDGVFVIRG